MAPQTVDSLADGLDRLAKKFRKRVRKSIPVRGNDEIDEAVHDLRTSTRRLLAHLLALEPFGGRPAARVTRKLEKVLGWTGTLRDMAVDQKRIEELKSGTAPVAEFMNGLRKDQPRKATKLRKKLDEVKARQICHEICRLSDMLREYRRKPKKILRAILREFGKVRDARSSLDFADPKTFHLLRISVKHFRFLMETLKPAQSLIRADAIEALQKLQTTLGDVHDLEGLASDLAARVKKKPDLARASAGILEQIEERRSTLLRSFLKTVDPILDSWEKTINRLREKK